MLEEAEVEAVEDLVQQEPTTTIKEEDNKICRKIYSKIAIEIAAETGGLLEVEEEGLMQIMMKDVGIVVNQATCNLNAIKSRMMRKDNSKITMQALVRKMEAKMH